MTTGESAETETSRRAAAENQRQGELASTRNVSRSHMCSTPGHLTERPMNLEQDATSYHDDNAHLLVVWETPKDGVVSLSISTTMLCLIALIAFVVAQ